MVVNAVIKTYLSDSANKIFVFTTLEAKKLIEAQDNTGERIQYILFDETETPEKFFISINSYSLDRLHYTTVTKYFKYFYKFKPNKNCKLFFHFHNVDLWYKSAFTIQLKRLWKVFFVDTAKVDIWRHLKYSLKDIWWDFYRKKFIYKITHDDSVMVILSEAQRFHLNRYFDASNAVVFPTLVFEPDYYKDLSVGNSKIRICIPGSVTQIRREYTKLFDNFEKHLEVYKENFTFDLLGFIPNSENGLLERMKSLKTKGLDIIYYESFIAVKQFDEELFKADILLSNLLLDDKESLQNKETATVFHMVRGAKPGIFPDSFILDDDFKKSVLKFINYENLYEIFMSLRSNKDRLLELKKEAEKISYAYSPESLLVRLNNAVH